MSDILRLKCTKFDFGWGSVLDPAGGAYSAPPDPLAGFKGPTSKGRGGEGRGGERRGEKGRGEGREGRERGREGPHQLGGPRAPKHIKTALTRPRKKFDDIFAVLRPCGCNIPT